MNLSGTPVCELEQNVSIKGMNASQFLRATANFCPCLPGDFMRAALVANDLRHYHQVLYCEIVEVSREMKRTSDEQSMQERKDR